MTSLLLSKTLPTISQTRSLNILNGSDAESLVAAKLLLALRAEISWGSREEDGRKIDLFLSCDHPWFKKDRLIVLSQVKSGSTYGNTIPSGGFTLKKQAYIKAQRTTHSIFMLWLDRDSDKAFWAYIHPHSNTTTNDYGVHHSLTPATYFDLARCVSRDFNIISDGKGIIIRHRSSNLIGRRKKVLNDYRSFQTVFCPTLGNIEITRLGWRHMFRKGRSLKHKKTSLNTIPYIKKILHHKPSEHAITHIKEWTSKGFCYRRAEHLLKYNSVQLSVRNEEMKTVTVISRIIEEIRYPSNWLSTAMLSQQVERRLVLKTIYYKV